MPAVDDAVGQLHHSTQPDQGLVVNLIATEQLSVVTEVAQEPAELPQRLGGAVEPRAEGAPNPGCGFENGEAQGIERFLTLLRIADLIDSNQEHAIGNLPLRLHGRSKTLETSFHAAPAVPGEA